MRFGVAVAIVCCLGASSALAEGSVSAGVEVTYLANEGFLLAAGDDKVLVDALFPGLGGYPRVEEPVGSKVLAAEAPFDGIDVALASHFHGDHFGAVEVARHVAASGAVFLSTPDAVAKLRRIRGGAAVEARGVYPAEGEREVFSFGEIRVTVLNLHHGRGRRPPVQNLGFIIEMGGSKILHVGDTEVAVADVRPYRLAEERIDVALLPSWFLAEPGMRPVVAEIAPTAIVVMHLARKDAPANYFGSGKSFEGRVDQIRAAFPQAWIPTETMASRRYSASRSSPRLNPRPGLHEDGS